MLIRRTMPRGVMRCRLIAINCFRSESPKVSPAALGTGISNTSMQAFALLVKLFQIHQTRIRGENRSVKHGSKKFNVDGKIP